MAYSDRDTSGSRIVAIVVVAIILAGVGYAFVTGLAVRFVKEAVTKTNVFDVEEPPPPPPEDPPPPPPDQPVVTPPVVTPPPIVQTNTPPPVVVQSVTTPPPAIVMTPQIRPKAVWWRASPSAPMAGSATAR
jgi:periplasmic protein TonB